MYSKSTTTVHVLNKFLQLYKCDPSKGHSQEKKSCTYVPRQHKSARSLLFFFFSFLQIIIPFFMQAFKKAKKDGRLFGSKRKQKLSTERVKNG